VDCDGDIVPVVVALCEPVPVDDGDPVLVALAVTLAVPVELVDGVSVSLLLVDADGLAEAPPLGFCDVLAVGVAVGVSVSLLLVDADGVAEALPFPPRPPDCVALAVAVGVSDTCKRRSHTPPTDSAWRRNNRSNRPLVLGVATTTTVQATATTPAKTCIFGTLHLAVRWNSANEARCGDWTLKVRAIYVNGESNSASWKYWRRTTPLLE